MPPPLQPDNTTAVIAAIANIKNQFLVNIAYLLVEKMENVSQTGIVSISASIS